MECAETINHPFVCRNHLQFTEEGKVRKSITDTSKAQQERPVKGHQNIAGRQYCFVWAFSFAGLARILNDQSADAFVGKFFADYFAEVLNEQTNLPNAN